MDHWQFGVENGTLAYAEPIDMQILNGLGIFPLVRAENYRTIQTVKRIGDEDMPASVLLLDKATRLLTLGESKDIVDQHVAEQRILEFLDAAREPQTQQHIRDGVQGDIKHIRVVLTSLVTSQKVKRTGEGKKGKPFYYEFWFAGMDAYEHTSKPESEKTAEPGKESETWGSVHSGMRAVEDTGSDEPEKKQNKRQKVTASERESETPAPELLPWDSKNEPKEPSWNGTEPQKVAATPSARGPETSPKYVPTPTYHCRIHPKNKTEWWLRGGVDPVCGLCHPHPAAGPGEINTGDATSKPSGQTSGDWDDLLRRLAELGKKGDSGRLM